MPAHQQVGGVTHGHRWFEAAWLAVAGGRVQAAIEAVGRDGEKSDHQHVGDGGGQGGVHHGYGGEHGSLHQVDGGGMVTQCWLASY